MSSSTMATTIWPLAAEFALWQMTRSPFEIPSSIMLSPATSRANRSSLAPNMLFSEIVSMFSIASMGLPAATLPTRGIPCVGRVSSVTTSAAIGE